MKLRSLSVLATLAMIFTAGIVGIINPNTALAQTVSVDPAKHVRICAGVPGKNFYAFAEMLKNKLDNSVFGITSELVESGGSEDNAQKIQKGECDYGPTQSNVAAAYGLIVMDKIFGNYGHLICGPEFKSRKITSIKHLIGFRKGGKVSISIDSDGSGANFTWKELGTLDKDYTDANFSTINIEIGEALPALIAGELDCAFTMTALNAPLMAQANANASKLVGLEMDDWDFNNSGKYEFLKLPEKTYAFFPGSVETIRTPNVLATNATTFKKKPKANQAMAILLSKVVAEFRAAKKLSE